MSVDAPPYLEALHAAMSLLDGCQGAGMIIGGLAVIAHGHVRTTDDIDATVSGASNSIESLLELAAARDIHPRNQEPVAFARRTQMLLLVHRPTGIEVDLSLAWIPFEEEALARRQTVTFRGVTLRLCSPEDLIVYKLVAARALDIEDARQLAMRHRSRVDRRRIGRTLREFDELLDDGRSRVALWEEIEESAFPGGLR
jgi:predicted nucleotidyltransferase